MRIIIQYILILAFLINSQALDAQPDTTTMYIFGHSLLDHRPPINPTPSDETTVPHWLHLLTEHENNHYKVSGQYGFLPQHANLPPFSQWGYDIVEGAWESDLEDFSEADFNKILITAGNFMQWQAPDAPYPGEGGMTPVSATEDIMDWLVLQEDEIDIYIYENWPDMAPYLSGGTFPPSDTDFENYNAYTLGAFHDWWIDYQDLLLDSRPDINIRMIPVGPIMAQLFGDTILHEIPILDLYEDDAPHGRPTAYFVASLITYMAVNDQKAAVDYSVPSIVNSIVADNYEALVDYIWNELNVFNDEDGESRVFYPSAPLPLTLLSFNGTTMEEGIELSWTTSHEEAMVQFEIQHSTDGLSFAPIGTIQGYGPSTVSQQYTFIHDTGNIGINFYRLRQVSPDGSIDFSDTIAVQIKQDVKAIRIYPNPAQHTLNIEQDLSGSLEYNIMSTFGEIVATGMITTDQQAIDLAALGQGVYILKIESEVFKFLKTK